ncbi:TSUP family transporter [Caballeronia cordobensis]|uniref:TSUP family transporter n=1 Tax=Caballeronia cordobensis TaxID=1353886 RepID=UPI00045EFE2D|nr:putative membrane protein [Burkholderia sp. RPE67]
MSTPSLVLFLLIVAIGSYLQAFTGFALGIFVLGAAVIFQLVKLETAATAINIMTLVNTAVALRGNMKRLNRKLAVQTLLGVLPGVPIGLWLLHTLSARSAQSLHLCLGVVVLLGGAILSLKPHPRPSTSKPSSFLIAGGLGGVLGGMFSIPGPPIIYQFYIQPLEINEVRLTLLSIFGVVSLLRIFVLGIDGSVGVHSIYLGLLSLPVVAFVTVLFIRFPPPVSEVACRRIAFSLLATMGVCIIWVGLR